MASLNREQHEAWMNAYRSAQDAGLSDGGASDAASRWSEDTNFGEYPPPISYKLGWKRPQKASSDIEKKIAAAAHKYDPTLTTEIFSGQENPLGVGQMSRSQRAKYNSLVSEGYPEDTAGRMIRADIQGTSLGRHPLGLASDARFLDMAGERLPRTKKSQEIADQIAFNFVQSTGGNWGRGGNGYMDKGTAHLDTAPLGKYATGPHWGDTTRGSRLAYGQAKALHDMGMTDASMLPIPTPRGFPGTSALEFEHPSDALGMPDAGVPSGGTAPQIDGHDKPSNANGNGLYPAQPDRSRTDASPTTSGRSKPPYAGPKKQIFDFVLRQLLNP